VVPPLLGKLPSQENDNGKTGEPFGTHISRAVFKIKKLKILAAKGISL
jgi:hypothetical protein